MESQDEWELTDTETALICALMPARAQAAPEMEAAEVFRRVVAEVLDLALGLRSGGLWVHSPGSQPTTVQIRGGKLVVSFKSEE